MEGVLKYTYVQLAYWFPVWNFLPLLKFEIKSTCKINPNCKNDHTAEVTETNSLQSICPNSIKILNNMSWVHWQKSIMLINSVQTHHFAMQNIIINMLSSGYSWPISKFPYDRPWFRSFWNSFSHSHHCVLFALVLSCYAVCPAVICWLLIID